MAPHSLKVGCVPFLNARPLIYNLNVEVKLEFPSKLAVSLHNGDYDVALAPVMECFIHPHYKILNRAGIVSRGPVWSVLLVLRDKVDDWNRVRTIALDKTSLTSHYLTRVICEKHLNIHATYVNEGESADADLWIGDRALDIRSKHHPARIKDLGECWHAFCGLPFLYAPWVVHKRAFAKQDLLNQFIDESLRGLQYKEKITQDATELAYLSKAIHYEVDEDVLAGLDLFRKQLVSLGVIDHTTPQLEVMAL
ncbi:MAG: MqnA/MqnD/SBP family protein [Verrucomicrobiota bacterium]